MVPSGRATGPAGRIPQYYATIQTGDVGGDGEVYWGVFPQIALRERLNLTI